MDSKFEAMMKKSKKFLVWLSLTLLFATIFTGCKGRIDKSKEKVREELKKREEVSIEGIPKVFIFPESKVINKFKVASESPGGGIACVLRTEKSFSKVEKYYREKPKEEGWAMRMDLGDKKEENFIFKKEDVDVTVHMEDLGKKREIVVTSNVVKTRD